MSNRAFLPAAALLVALGAAACSSGAAPSATPAPTGAPTEAPSPAATPTPVIQGIAHPTGAQDVVLRYDSAGGFVPPEFLAARVPYFTLYGDGRIVFVQTIGRAVERRHRRRAAAPDGAGSARSRSSRCSSSRSTTAGSRSPARATSNPMVADAPTAVFTINADNDSKTVSAMGLGHEQQPGPDAAVLAAARQPRGAAVATSTRAARSRATRTCRPPIAASSRRPPGSWACPVREWPWPDLKPSDFTLPKDPNVLQQATRTLTPDEAATLKRRRVPRTASPAGSTSGPRTRSSTRWSSGRCCPTSRTGDARRQLTSAKRSPA